MKTLMRWLLVLVLCSATIAGAMATDLGGCRETVVNAVQVQFDNATHPLVGDMTVQTIPGCVLDNVTNTTVAPVTVTFTQPVTLVFGAVQPGEIVVTDTSVFIDTFTRPDLDVPANLEFANQRFAVEPKLLRNGVVCGPPQCENKTYVGATYSVHVAGFSNYTLTGAQDFSVQSDPQPELKAKVYQTIDLGNSYRGEEFSCVVQIYGKNAQNQWVLAQTNPQRQVQSRMFGSPDMNQPESLGYFPTKNGLANVYFDGSTLGAYYDLEYVAQCANNATKLNYEEAISTRLPPLGRYTTGRLIWLASGDNQYYVIIYVVAGLIAFLLLIKFIRIVFPRTR